MVTPDPTKAVLPKDFLWGFATASYQIEGAPDTDGRGPSIWDSFCKIPGKIAGGCSGDVACDSYNRIAEDIELLKKTGAQAYRFSKGLDYYVKLVDDLLDAGITPMITLFHWDLPDELHKRYFGMLNKEEFVADFANYSRVLFKAMPKCKHWITFNEPWCSSILGYSTGLFAPGRTSDRTKSAEGDSSREGWIVGHNILIAHAHSVKIYREEFKPTNGGEIGDAVYPWDPEDPEDVEACDRKIEFSISWFADPIYFGHYPESMQKQLGDRLPNFTPEEVALVKGSNDFYGMNHYTAKYIKHKTTPAADDDFLGNLETLFESKNGDNIGPETQCFWLRPNPPGFRNLLGENDLPLEGILDDEFRAEYFRSYIAALAQAVEEDGVDVRAYMAWSLMDNFEWAEGYKTRFGVTFVDYEGGQKRFPKKSAKVVGPFFDKLIKKE
ncbi:hypothetical protein V492_00267 [Pseudogymnoascus sp. VKM F-4246]|nr:hypothetical protein V492_00267 [Pseudogymnoascus sp. VKM F-4246]